MPGLGHIVAAALLQIVVSVLLTVYSEIVYKQTFNTKFTKRETNLQNYSF